MRHIALNVKDVKRSQSFYTEFFGMTCEWEPDPQNAYLTTASQDNLALHEVAGLNVDLKNQALDHLGFIMTSVADVDGLYELAIKKSVVIVAAPKQHRDGAYSFYMRDPDGYVVQVIYHPPIVNALKG